MHLFFLIIGLGLSACTGSPPLERFPSSACGSYPDLAPSKQFRPFAVLGDTQKTSVWEKGLMGREDNVDDTFALLRGLAAEPVDFLVHLGDMVFDGSSSRHWELFDEQMAPLCARGLPVLPVLGNHEYWFNFRKGEAHALRRFPALRQKHWYLRQNGPVALVLLNSNLGKMSEEEQVAQLGWYRRTMKELEASPGTKMILVFMHHPPYTNSTVTGDEAEVQEAFLPAFMAAKKAVALFSGHAHTYERFKKSGKHFVVSGGGGGPRVELLDKGEARHMDSLALPDPRPFHYLILREAAGGLEVEARGFGKGEAKVRSLDRFVIP